jgi:hypothetical protein
MGVFNWQINIVYSILFIGKYYVETPGYRVIIIYDNYKTILTSVAYSVLPPLTTITLECFLLLFLESIPLPKACASHIEKKMWVKVQKHDKMDGAEKFLSISQCQTTVVYSVKCGSDLTLFFNGAEMFWCRTVFFNGCLTVLVPNFLVSL